MGRKRTIERRKHKRYKAVDGAFAAISPNSHKIGQILDIGMGGLSFKYIDNGKTSHDMEAEERIFLSSMGFYVGDLPFKTISDYPVDDAPSFNGMKIRRRHIQFTDLSFKQLFDLDCYLRNN
ncbi:MAG: hypothetical protein MI749_21085, partial [Desulfovibrionales bacterium]|nr:hypothetical protein [Desulfovibrionales bacterium]